jgi:Zn-dependent peptidase ImmA (M78 family)
MPTALIKTAWVQMRTKVQRDDFELIVAELAKRFEVSEQAMTLRLKSLRYL